MMSAEEKAAIIAKYTAESIKDDAQYSPLQCAAYSADREAVSVLLGAYEQNSTLAQELSYAGGKFGENILHIAIKDPVIFANCCVALKLTKLLVNAIMQKDVDGDTVMHQVVEFGRQESLAVLTSDEEVQPLLVDAINIQNKHGESAVDLADHFEKSATIGAMMKDGVLKAEHLVVARQNLSSIHEIFTSLAVPRSTFGC